MSVDRRQFHATLFVRHRGVNRDSGPNVVVGKNYRLQNIQLSKISIAGISSNLFTSVRSEQPLAQRSRSPRRRRAFQSLPRPSTRSGRPELIAGRRSCRVRYLAPDPAPRKAGLIRSPKLFQISRRRMDKTRPICGWSCSDQQNFCYRSASALRALAPRLFACISEKLVENTGLEPVTSWLQTRRSPS